MRKPAERQYHCHMRDPMDAQERVTELTQKMLRRKLYAIFGKTVVSPEKLMPLLPAHLEYLIGLEKRGLLFASGPLTEVWGGTARWRRVDCP